MALYLIRHSRPAIDPGVCYGHLDVPLAEPPTAAAAALRARLPPDLRVLSSPSRRCRELAGALAPAITLDPRLMEMNFGEWEGRSWDTLPRRQIDAWADDPAGYTPPGGEPATAVLARALAVVTEQGGRDTALVTHGGVIRVLLAHWQQLPPRRWSEIRPAFGAAYCVRPGPSTPWAPGSVIVVPC